MRKGGAPRSSSAPPTLALCRGPSTGLRGRLHLSADAGLHRRGRQRRLGFFHSSGSAFTPIGWPKQPLLGISVEEILVFRNTRGCCGWRGKRAATRHRANATRFCSAGLGRALRGELGRGFSEIFWPVRELFSCQHPGLDGSEPVVQPKVGMASIE